MSMMDFRSARSKAKSLLAPKRPQDLSRSALTEDALRDNIISETEQHSERFRKAVRKSPEVTYEVTDDDGNVEERKFTWDGYGETVRDMARALFGIDQPEVRPANEVRPDALLGRDVTQFTINDPAFMEAHPHSRLNETESIYGAMAYADDLRDSAGKILAEHVKQSEDARAASDQMQSADELMDSLRNRAKQDVADHGTVQQGTRRGIKQGLKGHAQAQANLGQIMQQQSQSGQVLAAAQAAASASQAAGEAVDAVANLPGVGGGQSQNMTPDMQIELAEKWGSNERLKRIMREVGRMYRDMRFKRETRTKNVPIEPVGITTGNTISRLLPHEAAKMHMGKLIRGLFVKDWSERKLLEYEMQGKLPAGKGPIITCSDGSGSMNGEPVIFANSLAVCACMIAIREKRPFAHIQFGSHGQMKSWYFPKGEDPDPDRLLEMAGHLFGGGTHTATGMAEALRLIEDEPTFTTADVVLIGDGQDYYRDEDQAIHNRLVELDVTIHGITICTGANPYFDQMCSWHVDITDLAHTSDATNAIAENIT